MMGNNPYSQNIKVAIRLILVLASLPLLGALGFVLIEDWSFFDSLYMAIITLSTVGYEEVHELTHYGRIFVMVYLVLGLGIFLFSVAQVGEIVVRAELRDWLGRRKMDSKLKTLNGHFIVCGVGRVGYSICRYLAERNLPFVAIDNDDSSLAECQKEGWHWLKGDATDDATLLEAGIERARGLTSVLSSDADNVFVVLSARLMSKSIQIISRASSDKNETKIMRAGADRVIMLYATGAHRMAQFMTNSKVHEFTEIFTEEGSEMDLAEIQVSEKSAYAGKQLRETDFRERGIMIVAVRRKGIKLQIPPAASELIRAGDSLIAVGSAGAVAGIGDLL